MGNKGFTEERKIVSRLIYMVLTDTLTVREAILRFPKDVNDSTIKTAYHALVHRESDEEYRRMNLEYKDEQDDYLEFIAQILQTGGTLPKNLIESYNKYYKDANMPHSESMKGLIKSLCKFLNV
jgi:hypothetical protein